MLVLLVVLQCRLRGSRLGLAVDRLETEVLYLIKTKDLKAGTSTSFPFIQPHKHAGVHKDFLACWNRQWLKSEELCCCCCKHIGPWFGLPIFLFCYFGWICEVDYDNSSMMEIRRYEPPLSRLLQENRMKNQCCKCINSLLSCGITIMTYFNTTEIQFIWT